ncbi:glycoside hydrolase family 127 protein [Cohnella sp. WQ 127256]|uniref:glycoside hydrolase family 127 protein n=1 Tax=Cohnella sp. WQ 127256 TaxID=2938790 RepID=UPI002117483C|nr:beta-L-arabinofuranosidase domain-containing protein [Cohnella sp. WQ 127256]
MVKIEKLTNVSYKEVKIHDPFWTKYMHLVRDEVIPYQWDALNDRIEDAAPSHAIENFRIAAGEAEGDFYGYIFQDSDVAKWLEAVAYSLATSPDLVLEKLADETIDLLGRAQQADGYLNTHFTIKYPDKRWTNERDNHETYCAGHLIEAAVAYYETTGKVKLLDIVCKLADHIDSIYGPEVGKLRGYSGHQEIELALMRLYEVTGVERYLKLSLFFIDERGQEPHFFKLEADQRAERFGRESLLKEGYYNLYKHNYEYNQSHLPVREQLHAVGHAVRAVYMYAGMTDVAAATQDQTLIDSCKRLWDNVTQKQMYITGGIGSNHDGEAFSFDYDLPNDTAYTETCAAIGLVFWAQRMLHLDPHGKYADVIERALYNGTISGMSLDGRSFFYVNPLEVWPDACNRPDKMHVEPVRQKWFGCACCPPNIARLIASLGRYIYSQSEQTIYVHQYIGSGTNIEVAGRSVHLSQQTNFPWDETIELTVTPDRPGQFAVAVRVPGWCEDATVHVNGQDVQVEANLHNGYVTINREWKTGDVVQIVLPMPVKRIYANPNVRVNAGKVALQRGPVVYCLEQVDNGAILPDIALPEHAILDARFEPDELGGVTVITGEAVRGELIDENAALYTAKKRSESSIKIKAIPYFAWANRGAGEMQVWIRER